MNSEYLYSSSDYEKQSSKWSRKTLTILALLGVSAVAYNSQYGASNLAISNKNGLVNLQEDETTTGDESTDANDATATGDTEEAEPEVVEEPVEPGELCELFTRPQELEFVEPILLEDNTKTMTLIYDSAENDWDSTSFDAAKFHTACDGQANTLTIMRSNTFNRTFGGFAAVAWDSEGLWVEDPDAYLFSIDDQTKFYQEDPTRPALYHDAQDGPSFWDLFCFNDLGSNVQCYDRIGQNFVKEDETYAAIAAAEAQAAAAAEAQAAADAEAQAAADAEAEAAALAEETADETTEETTETTEETTDTTDETADTTEESTENTEETEEEYVEFTQEIRGGDLCCKGSNYGNLAGDYDRFQIDRVMIYTLE